MSTSILIGRLLAVVYLAAGLGMLLRPAHYRKMMDEMTKSAGLQFFGGIMALIVGLLIVMNHNLWTASWTLILTIIGWAGLIKGIGLLAVPDLFLKQFEGIMGKPWLFSAAGGGTLVMGAILGYFSFLA